MIIYYIYYIYNIMDIYLDDYSKEELIDYSIIKSDIIETNTIINKNNKPSISMKSDFNSKGERIAVFSIKIPLKKEKDSLTIDILINDEMYKDIGKYLG